MIQSRCENTKRNSFVLTFRQIPKKASLHSIEKIMRDHSLLMASEYLASLLTLSKLL